MNPNNIDIEKKIILLIVYCMPNFRNSYQLFRVLNLKFEIFSPGILLNDLVDNMYLEKEKSNNNGVSNYIITRKGIKSLEADFIDFRVALLQKFPKDEAFINTLASKIIPHCP